MSSLKTDNMGQALKIAKLEAQMESVSKLLEKLANDSKKHGLALERILIILENKRERDAE